MFTDHFAALGLARDASPNEIKAAYRLLVRRYHPDMGEGFPVERFHAIQEAWEVLRSVEGRQLHRSELERSGRRPPRETWRPNPQPGPRSRGRSDGSSARRQADRTPSDLGPVPGFEPLRDLELGTVHLELELHRELAVRGGHFTTRVPVDLGCPACHGHQMASPACDMCAGTGRLRLRVRTSIRLPAGIRSGDLLDVHCYFELFGHRQATARIFLV